MKTDMLWNTGAAGPSPSSRSAVLVTSLPGDCTEREANLLGALLPGFHSCEPKLNVPESPQAVLWFFSPESAQMAVDRLHGFQFDARTRLEARVVTGKGHHPGNNMTNTNDLNPNLSPNLDPNLSPNLDPNLNPNPNPTNAAPTAEATHSPMMPATYYYAPMTTMVMPNMPANPAMIVSPQMPQMAQIPQMARMPRGNHRGNPPCNTLFIGNLTVGASEVELEDVFCRFEGFVKVKLATTRKGMSAFVEFTTVENAVEALKNSQNVVLKSSSGRGAIRVQYSKNPLGSRGDSRLLFAPVGSGLGPVPVGSGLGPVPVGSGCVPGAPVGSAPGMYFVQQQLSGELFPVAAPDETAGTHDTLSQQQHQ